MEGAIPGLGSQRSPGAYSWAGEGRRIRSPPGERDPSQSTRQGAVPEGKKPNFSARYPGSSSGPVLGPPELWAPTGMEMELQLTAVGLWLTPELEGGPYAKKKWRAYGPPCPKASSCPKASPCPPSCMLACGSSGDTWPVLGPNAGKGFVHLALDPECPYWPCAK